MTHYQFPPAFNCRDEVFHSPATNLKRELDLDCYETSFSLRKMCTVKTLLRRRGSAGSLFDIFCLNSRSKVIITRLKVKTANRSCGLCIYTKP